MRNAPTNTAVAAALDALIEAGDKLSPAAVAAAAQAATGKSERNPQRFVTMLERLLNVDGSPWTRADAPSGAGSVRTASVPSH
ncbi:hypothetical protein [Streptomyces sp. NRRL S-1022]|uniref:hypothetical protein n=1 Tax=Streptomyces sp. NRRL S-1022 TaxID=1463880 RepID=UPI00099DE129|nr:hypothetical protein [Streptomyces sp. NRRL S-1022]